MSECYVKEILLGDLFTEAGRYSHLSAMSVGEDQACRQYRDLCLSVKRDEDCSYVVSVGLESHRPLSLSWGSLDLELALDTAFSYVFTDHLESYYALRGSFDPWIHPTNFRHTCLGDFTIVHFGDRIRQWVGHLGMVPVFIVERLNGPSSTWIHIRKTPLEGLVTSELHKGYPVVKFENDDFEAAIRALNAWKTQFFEAADTIRKVFFRSSVCWAQHLLEDPLGMDS